MKLSILICTLPKRIEMLDRLLKLLNLQYDPDVEILVNNDEQMSIGQKRNYLLKAAKGEYVCFIDDDDIVDAYYIERLMKGIKRGVDCCSLRGIITTDGANPKPFIHSMEYKEWFEKDGVYYRGINHLNCIKREIALQIGFPEKNHGEDYDYSMKLMKSGLLHTQQEIAETLYYYQYITKK